MPNPHIRLHALVHKATRHGLVLEEIARASGLSLGAVAQVFQVANPRDRWGKAIVSPDRAREAAQKLKEALR